MKTTHRSIRPLIPPLLILLAATGCQRDRDERLANFAQHATEQQARQNEVISRQSEAVVAQSDKLAQAAQELVAKDAETRRELVRAQHDLNSSLQLERADVDRQKEMIDRERQELAIEKVRAPVIAEAIRAIGILLACLAPLALVAWLVYAMSRKGDDEAVINELLLTELMSDQPRFLPSPSQMAPRLEHETSAQRQPGTNDPEDVTEQ
jgi:hypothetical protein